MIAKPQGAIKRREGLRGNQALYEENRKRQAAKEKAEHETLFESPLVTPPENTPAASTKATARTKRSSKASLATKLEYSSTSSEDADTVK
jgi:hypothetical protein